MAQRFMPLQAGTIVTSPYGPRGGEFHGGTDFGKTGGSAGLPVYACQAGTVIYAGAASGYGGPDPAGWLVIDSDDSQGSGCCEYGHIIREVGVGAKVAAGQRIGRINPDSRTNGGVAPHLHLTVWKYAYGGERVDPVRWLAGAPHIDSKPAPTTAPKETTVAVSYGVTHRISAGNDGDRSRDDYLVPHTQEGGSGDAVGLANYCKEAGVSYNAAVDDERTVEMVPPRLAPWAAVAANDLGVHVCAAGSFASWSRGRWLSADAADGLNEDKMLWRMAQYFAAASQQFGIPVKLTGAKAYASGNWPSGRGIAGHVAFGARGGGHFDPGGGFPYDVLIQRINWLIEPAPVPNLINREAEAAKAWIGARLDKDEKKILSAGKEIGRRVEFANGQIYWRAGASAAYAIPEGGIWEAFTARRWEQGIGFPVRRHEVFAWGGNQSFEQGTLFVPKGGPVSGFLVHGEIGKRYALMGWETGPLGLPTSDEQKVPNTDNIVQFFEHGDLRWSPTGVIVNLTKGVSA